MQDLFYLEFTLKVNRVSLTIISFVVEVLLIPQHILTSRGELLAERAVNPTMSLKYIEADVKVSAMTACPVTRRLHTDLNTKEMNLNNQ